MFALGLGGEAVAQSSEDDELKELLNLLNEQTSLATETRLNADFVPGMYSVLEGEAMQRRGFRTLWEALAAVPGVQTVMNGTGMRSISVRGVGELFESSKVKLLLNGVAVNSSASATTGTIYDTPVEQIERVEFIRGPGSAIYGEFAFAGVLNVITHREGKAFGVGIEDGSGLNAYGQFEFAPDSNGLAASLSIAASQTNGVDIDSGDDRSPPAIPGYAPGPINNKRNSVSAFLDLQWDSLNALIQLQQSNRGDHFGTNDLLPPDDRQTVISESLLSAGLSQDFEVDEDLAGAWSLTAVQHNTEQNSLFLGVAPIYGGLSSEDDIIADSDLEEQRFEAKAHLTYRGEQHKLFAELSAAEVRIGASDQFINLDPLTNLPSPMLNEFPGPVDRSLDRNSVSLVLQDEYDIDDSLTLTSGLRYDNYQDIDDNISPRIALVWRQSDNHIYKAQLARAFRPPSLIEFGGSIESSNEPETNDTLEFGYIFHSTDLVLRNTIYFSRLDNLIVFQDSAPFGYLNSDAQDLYGYEIELQQSIGTKWHINASLSLQDYKDDGLPGAAPWLIKFGADYEIAALTGINLEINSAASRDRESGDPRGDFPQTTQADLTLRRHNLSGIDGLSLRVGIRNLLDERLEHPSPVDTYPDDYPYSDGALLWMQLLYQPL